MDMGKVMGAIGVFYRPCLLANHRPSTPTSNLGRPAHTWFVMLNCKCDIRIWEMLTDHFQFSQTRNLIFLLGTWVLTEQSDDRFYLFRSRSTRRTNMLPMLPPQLHRKESILRPFEVSTVVDSFLELLKRKDQEIAYTLQLVSA